MGEFSTLSVGVLELQGDFAEHTAMLRRCGVGKVVGVRQAEDLKDIDALVIPGGESTTISKLLVEQDMMKPIQKLAQDGLPMFGTCAGCILLANEIRQRPNQPRIGVMEIAVDRNAYGSQIDSFEAHVSASCPELQDGGPLRVVHIRAPIIAQVSESICILASYDKKPILVQQKFLLACTFHPELTTDQRIHLLFLRLVNDCKSKKNSPKT